MLSCVIDEMEGQEVATAKIPGTFLQTDYEKGDIHTKPEGAIVNLLEEIDPEYYKKISTKINVEGSACMHNPIRLSTEH